MNNQLVFKAKDLIPVIVEARKNNCPVLLVKDDGVYIISQIRDSAENICFAVDCNPRIDEDWYEYAEGIMGGDDSCDLFHCNELIFNVVINHNRNLKIIVTENEYKLTI